MATATTSDGPLAELSAQIRQLRDLDLDDPARTHAERVMDSFVRESRRARRRVRREADAVTDAGLAATTATGGTARREDAPLLPPPPDAGGAQYRRPKRCYVCKQSYRQLDGFYHQLCPDCAADNRARRGLSTDLRGRRALITGGRVKIGFQLALMMLRDGAEVVVTSRFPKDTLRRFLAAEGSDGWWDRLHVVGIDLRDPRQVLGLTAGLRAEQRPLDILVNNAAQTLRRPPEAYALLAAGEEHAHLPRGAAQSMSLAPGFRPLPALRPAWPAAELTTAPGAGQVARLPDEAGLLPDTAAANSWSVRLGGLDPAELLEVQLVNAVAPALLCDQVLPLLLASPRDRRYVVNVTAVEGRFEVRNKTGGHPHTNMAKAALNMLTRTSAEELARQGVYMCAVDTGWITDENPLPKKQWLADRGFRTPLDVVDGAARVYDPIVRGEAGDPVAGVFLKDYREAAW